MLIVFLRSFDQTKPPKYPINIGHATDISKCFWSFYQWLSFRLFKSQQYRTPHQALAAFPAVDPQFLGRRPIPSGLDLIGKRQACIYLSDWVLPQKSVLQLNSNHKLSCQKSATAPSVHSSLYHFQFAVSPIDEPIGKR